MYAALPIAVTTFPAGSPSDGRHCEVARGADCYDFTQLFELAVSAAWEKAPAACSAPPSTKVSAVELVLTRDKSGVEPLATPSAAADRTDVGCML